MSSLRWQNVFRPNVGQPHVSQPNVSQSFYVVFFDQSTWNHYTITILDQLSI
jgi:hypothetical protein